MFIQVIQGAVRDAELWRNSMETWERDLRPGAVGVLGATGGLTADGRAIVMARFESEDAARANSGRPEQGAWWSEASKAFEGDVAFHDCREVDLLLGGGSDEAGFVQIIQGRAKDPQQLRRLSEESQAILRERRPDVLGMVVAWHGDGGFTQAVYFTSEGEARRMEKATEGDELRQRFMDAFDGPPTFFDLPDPILG